MVSSGNESAWGFDIRDAGPPVSLAFCAGWVGVSLLAYFLFTVIRPAATRQARDATTSTDVSPRPSRSAPSMWFPSQLFFTAWAWCVLDGVHRTYCYVLLSPTMLWRRSMLPLAATWSTGFWSSWVNQVRFVVHCRGLWPGQPSSPVGARCLEYKLPVSHLEPNHMDAHRDQLYATAVPPFASPDVRARNCHQFHLIAVYSVLTTVAVLVGAASETRRVQRLWRVWWQPKQTAEPLTKEETVPEAGAVDGNDDPTEATAEADSETHAFTTAHSQFYVQGADDAWLNSAEAAAEYARWERTESAAAADAMPELDLTQRGRMHQVICDTWPTLLGALYGGLYAATGGMPLLMMLLFPVVCVVAIASALYCSID